MAASQSLRRVLSVRQVEEDQCRAQMESVMGELRRLQSVLKVTLKRTRRARALIVSSGRSGEAVDRIAALEEMTAAERLMDSLTVRMAAAEADFASVRQRFLNKRMERRQIESVIEAADAREVIEQSRKSQCALDDWHLLQRIRKESSGCLPDTEI